MMGVSIICRLSWCQRECQTPVNALVRQTVLPGIACAGALAEAESMEGALACLGTALSFLLVEKAGGLVGCTVIPVIVGSDWASGTGNALLMLDGGQSLEAARYSIPSHASMLGAAAAVEDEE